jgi:O-succinylbenzoic acid--CoA ligase
VIEDAYDFAAFTPMQLIGLSEREMRRFAAIRTVIVGGAAVPSALRRQLTARGNEVFETYGMAETLSHVAVRRFAEQEVPFEALAGVRFRADDEGRLVITIKHLGELEVRTQDVVSLIDDRHFYYRGRFDSMINSGGIKLFPEVIEKKLQGTLTIPFYIGSEADAVLGERVVLYVESAETPDEQQLLGRCREVLTGYEVPKAVRAQYPFERTESGKIKRIKK